MSESQAISMEESTTESLASERPYRSRTQPPCNRCRSRKQRCITRPSGSCINCQIAGTPCVINSPPEGSRSRYKPAKGEKQNKRQRLSEDGDEVGTGKHKAQYTPDPTYVTSPVGLSGSTMSSASTPQLRVRVQSPQYQQVVPIHPPPPMPSLSPAVETVSYTSPSNPIGMGSNFSTIISSWDYSHTASVSDLSHNNADEQLRPLDADAGDEFEPHYVGGTAERDALVLSAIASATKGESSDGTDASTSRHSSGQPSTFRVRQVSTNQAQPVFFLFERTTPYGEDTDTQKILNEFLDLVGRENTYRLLQKYLNIDGLAVPIWSPEHFQDNSTRYVPPGLYCAYIARGLIHDDQLRHLTRTGWKLTLQIVRPESKRARLATIQANLLDLDGRPSLNPTGNSVVLGQTIASARLLGLHLDCSDWSIPSWEKNLRIKLWWGLLQQDKWAALCCGRTSYIHFNDWDVPLPSSSNSSPPFDCFISLCELTLILDRILRDLHVVRSLSTMKDSLTSIASFGFELDSWKQRLDSRTSRMSTPPPGLRSLELSYLAVALLLARSALDRELPPNVLRSAQESAFSITNQVISFTTSLTPDDLRGYWTIHSAFHFSTCLVLLIRLTLQSDLNDQSDEAIWQRALHQLHVFITALSNAKRSVASFELGDLALARARHLIPLLTHQIPELSVVLEPLNDPPSLPTPSPSNGELDGHEMEYTQGLDAFFPELAETDWASVRDFMPYPFNWNALNAAPTWQY